MEHTVGYGRHFEIKMDMVGLLLLMVNPPIVLLLKLSLDQFLRGLNLTIFVETLDVSTLTIWRQ
jgi:hypothetical protein